MSPLLAAWAFAFMLPVSFGVSAFVGARLAAAIIKRRNQR